MIAYDITKKVHTTQRGNGLAATQNVPSNSVLMCVPNPYILLPDKASLSRICSWCLLPVSSSNLNPKSKCVAALKKCSACKISQYCSASCQRADWNDIHAKECTHLKKLPDIPPTPVRATMRVLLRHRLGFIWDPRWADLQGHEGEIKSYAENNRRENWGDILLQAKAAMTFSGLTGPANMELAIAVLCRITCNAFRATLPDATPIGLCFEPAIAFVNHSCRPNSQVIFEGRVMILRSLTTIKQDEELFISYIDNSQTRGTRRHDLWRTYFFWCDCPECENEVKICNFRKPKMNEMT